MYALCFDNKRTVLNAASLMVAFSALIMIARRSSKLVCLKIDAVSLNSAKFPNKRNIEAFNDGSVLSPLSKILNASNSKPIKCFLS
jgi:hypothetical protein